MRSSHTRSSSSYTTMNSHTESAPTSLLLQRFQTLLTESKQQAATAFQAQTQTFTDLLKLQTELQQELNKSESKNTHANIRINELETELRTLRQQNDDAASEAEKEENETLEPDNTNAQSSTITINRAALNKAADAKYTEGIALFKNVDINHRDSIKAYDIALNTLDNACELLTPLKLIHKFKKRHRYTVTKYEKIADEFYDKAESLSAENSEATNFYNHAKTLYQKTIQKYQENRYECFDAHTIQTKLINLHFSIINIFEKTITPHERRQTITDYCSENKLLALINTLSDSNNKSYYTSLLNQHKNTETQLEASLPSSSAIHSLQPALPLITESKKRKHTELQPTTSETPNFSSSSSNSTFSTANFLAQTMWHLQHISSQPPMHIPTSNEFSSSSSSSTNNLINARLATTINNSSTSRQNTSPPTIPFNNNLAAPPRAVTSLSHYGMFSPTPFLDNSSDQSSLLRSENLRESDNPLDYEYYPHTRS